MPGEAVARILFRNEELLVGEFWCPPQSARWRTLNRVSPAAHVVFPRTRVAIRQVGRETVLADRNLVIFYNPGQRFFRTLRDAHGDHCYFVEVEPGAWAALTGDEGETKLSFAFGPSDPAVYLLQHAAIADLREQRCDPLVVEENLAEAVARAVADARAFHGRRTTPRRRSTRRPIATSRTRRRSSLASSSASGSRWVRSRPRSARRSTTSRGSSGPGPASRCTATGTSYGSEWRWSASPTRGRASPRSPTSSAT